MAYQSSLSQEFAQCVTRLQDFQARVATSVSAQVEVEVQEALQLLQITCNRLARVLPAAAQVSAAAQPVNVEVKSPGPALTEAEAQQLSQYLNPVRDKLQLLSQVADRNVALERLANSYQAQKPKVAKLQSDVKRLQEEEDNFRKAIATARADIIKQDEEIATQQSRMPANADTKVNATYRTICQTNIDKAKAKKAAAIQLINREPELPGMVQNTLGARQDLKIAIEKLDGLQNDLLHRLDEQYNSIETSAALSSLRPVAVERKEIWSDELQRGQLDLFVRTCTEKVTHQVNLLINQCLNQATAAGLEDTRNKLTARLNAMSSEANTSADYVVSLLETLNLNV